MPVTFVLSHHIYNDFKSFIPDPKTKTNLWSIKDYSENVLLAVESVCDLSGTAEIWGRQLKSCHFDFTRLLKRHRKRAVCWRASENEPFVEAPPKTNRLLTRHRKLFVVRRYRIISADRSLRLHASNNHTERQRSGVHGIWLYVLTVLNIDRSNFFKPL